MPSDAESFETRIVSEQIEQSIFKDADLDIHEVGPVDYTLIIYEGPAGKPMFKSGGARWKMGNFSVITNKGYFVEVPEFSYVLIDKVMVDNIDYDYPILIKGSNREQYWTKEIAADDAQYYFTVDFLSQLPPGALEAFLITEDFKLSFAYPKLKELAQKIVDKQHSGEYSDEYGGFLEREKDFAELFAAAQESGVDKEFCERLFSFLKEEKEKPSWWERNPLLTGVIAGVIGTLIVSKAIPFFFKFVRKRYAERKRKRINIKRSETKKKKRGNRGKKR